MMSCTSVAKRQCPGPTSTVPGRNCSACPPKGTWQTRTTIRVLEIYSWFLRNKSSAKKKKKKFFVFCCYFIVLSSLPSSLWISMMFTLYRYFLQEIVAFGFDIQMFWSFRAYKINRSRVAPDWQKSMFFQPVATMNRDPFCGLIHTLA